MNSHNSRMQCFCLVIKYVCFNDSIRLAAYTAAEENAKLVNNISTSLEASNIEEEDDDYDEDEETILVSLHF